jgi:hypothetical protein
MQHRVAPLRLKFALMGSRTFVASTISCLAQIRTRMGELKQKGNYKTRLDPAFESLAFT